ncbi:MAG: rRNA (uracil1939-C5)-methyltransferase, partial [Bradyrhizobium sp.]|nr:rRNA (uracil1939-C5)-methyltransferase [Bradyrhizobium sp.]
MARDVKPGEVQEADVVDLAHDGRGIARDAGKAVFIEGALPGERVRFRVLKRRRHLDEAGLVDVLVASPDRVVPACAHFGICGGCSLQHLSAQSQLAAKERQLLENLERIGKVSPERVLAPLRGPAWAYRRRARLGIKYVHKKGRVLAGFREREKPYIADIQRCEVLQEPLANLPRDLAALVEA